VLPIAEVAPLVRVLVLDGTPAVRHQRAGAIGRFRLLWPKVMQNGESDLPRIPKTRSSQNSYSMHSGE